jgi:voltage-gated potassium channel
VRHNLHYALLATLTLLVGGALAMDAAESGGRGPIHGLPDALWWAASTMTTVGYGDVYPVTPLGRGIALVLMVGGIAFFGVLTANLAAFLLERAEAHRPHVPAPDAPAALAALDVAARLDELLDRLTAIEARLPERLSDPPDASLSSG